MKSATSRLKDVIKSILPDNPVDGSDLATLWHVATQADLLRILDRADAKSVRIQEREQQVMDTEASVYTGREIKTGSANNEDGMDINLNSPTINNPPPPAPIAPVVFPPTTPAWAKCVMAAILAATILGLTILPSIINNPPNTQPPSPPPSQGELHIK